MKNDGLAEQRISSEEALKNPTFDYYAKYYAVFHLNSMAERDPLSIVPETVSALSGLLDDARFAGSRSGYFLFRLAAETLTAIALRAENSRLAGLALASLENIVCTGNGNAHKAAAETLGALPLGVRGPDIAAPEIDIAPRVSFRSILDRNGFRTSGEPRYFGRSLVAPMTDGRLLVFKLARAGESPDPLLREALWMEYLGSNGNGLRERIGVPGAVKFGRRWLFSLRGVPACGNARLHPKRYAICFAADGDYFNYPNHFSEEFGDGRFLEIMSKNARLLGELASKGIIHSAPIPLFHNRIQTHRRRDRGHYEWFRGGRLDRWLESCSYPNIGVNGLRDFEHFVSFQGPDRELYRHVGTQILSLLLMAGSRFRNKNPGKTGLDENGYPVDARDLFDKRVLKEIVAGVFSNYYRGFTGSGFTGGLPFDPDLLTGRMIDEMGVDRYMEETLRVPDQNEMSDGEFRQFLADGGYSKEEIQSAKKGESEIVLQTGPHLGAFNRQTSLPELTEAVATMSALCVLGRYVKETGV